MSINVYGSRQSIPNKLLNEDGSITDLMGNSVIPTSQLWRSRRSLPNKFLNADGSYSTLQEILAGSIDTNIYEIVDELPEEGETSKIYLVPDGNGKFNEYLWTGDGWDNIGMLEFDIDNYYTKSDVDTNFLKKNNTTVYTPTQNYNPATKKYVDDNAVTFKPFPNGFVTNSTTSAFLNSIEALSLPAGMAYLGQVNLSDMPDGVTVQAEVEVYVYPQNVIYCVMRSAEVSPYIWGCNSYEYRGWESTDKTAKDYADTNFLKKDNTTPYTPSGNYNPVTKKYVDDIVGDIESVLETLDVGGGV